MVIALLSYAPKTLAIKENIFPESNSVQPLPSSSPNISGNIDWPNGPPDQNTTIDNNPFGDPGSIDNNPSDSDTSNSNPSTVDNTNNNNAAAGGQNSNNGAGGNNSFSNSSTNSQPSSNAAGSNANSAGGNSAGSSGASNNTNGSGSNGNQSNGQPNQNFISDYNFGNDQTQNQTDNATPAPTDNTNSDKIIQNIDGQPQTKSPINETTFAWTIAFGSGLLLIAAYILWRLKKNPDDVNQ